MTRTMTILALACCVITGVALAEIFGHGNVLMVRFVATPSPQFAEGEPFESAATRERKADRLPVMLQAGTPDAEGALPESLRPAVATDSPFDAEILPSTPPIEEPPLPRPRPKLANQFVQKDYSLLSDMQIAALKGRLRLTPGQEPYWPAVERALREAAQKIHERRSAPGKQPVLRAGEIEQIKVAAQPLLTRLREDQKREVRALARMIGLEAVASLI
ncbi:hypothetical protein [Nitrobacter winogradskyi]|uniref:Uncharacterized protein n=2 Tax=Nitrobacter winogradskyi TaxID=913 RepID=A0ACC6AJG5_NITWI|nr:hypothetical protein [Nitrobacter winogradskyi]MCP1999421.1 hypothetical protein [Nitrobacter winogradskyi]GEC16085.1 hypothetical protein NWI01_19770 [Nitrobacter winogradskyi]